MKRHDHQPGFFLWLGKAAVLLLALLFVPTGSAHGQILQGRWVQDSEKEIEQHRKTDVSVIVLDENDRAVHGAAVRLLQKRHDFIIGSTLPAERMPKEGVESQQIYRCFNAIALDRHTDWSTRLNDADVDPTKLIDAWTNAIDPIRTEYGRVVSADPARNDDKLSRLGPTQLRDAVMGHIDLAIKHDAQPDGFDLYADILNQDMIERKLGVGMVHRLFERAEARRPEADFSLRVRDAISLQRGRELVSRVQSMEIRQVAFSGVSIEQRFNGQIQPLPLKRMFNDYIGALPVPATLVGLEVSGPTDVAAALNMETVVRLAFAQPNIKGIYLSGLYQDELIEPNAALIDDKGIPTMAGLTIDGLFNETWWTDDARVTDEAGNIQHRVFTGWYEISATLPGGRRISMQTYIPKDSRTKIIVLQATAAEREPAAP